MGQPFALRLPCKFAQEAQQFTPPSNEWIDGTWFVTHTSLPLWKDKRNVTLTYKRLPPDATGVEKLDDRAQYQAMSSNKIQNVHGIDSPSPGNPGAWKWRGTGWQKIATSRWEVLGYGDLEDRNQWVVSYFGKTLFTPAGVDIYSREKGGLPQAALDAILASLRTLNAADVRELADRVYEVTRD